MIETLRKATGFLEPRERRRWLLLVPVAVAAAVLESTAALAILALIRLLVDPLQPAGPGAAIPPGEGLASVLELGGWVERVPRLWLAAGAALVVLLKNGVRLGEAYARARLAADSAARIGSRLLGGYLRAAWPRHLGWNSAHLIRNVTGGAESICAVVLTSATAAASELLAVAAIVAILVLAAPGRVLGFVAMTAALVGLLLWLTQRSFTRWGRGVHELAGASYQLAQQTLASSKVVKVLGREAFFERGFAALRQALAGMLAHRAALAALPRLVVETIFVVTVAVMAALSVPSVSEAAGWFAFIGFAAYAGLRILPSVHLIVFHLNNVRFGKAAVDELHADWEELVVGQGGWAEARKEREEERPVQFERDLVVDRVSFTYPGETEPTLREVSLTLRKGESVGIIGPTGSGKTTLLDLLLGLLEPTTGAILVDGVDIRSAPGTWQRQVGYVPQDAPLIDDTLRRNIALGIEDDRIVEERIEEAVRLARLEALVGRLPRGLATVVGERGARLSGGERQRVAIARMLYDRPEILVFDEATAALDRQTERELHAGIESLRGTKTLIIVAHRLATVRSCDWVILLREGRIADAGPLPELVARVRRRRRGLPSEHGAARQR